MTTFLTKSQRSILTDWFIEQLIETESQFLDDSEDAERKSLASLNNVQFHEIMLDQMPTCMNDLKNL